MPVESLVDRRPLSGEEAICISSKYLGFLLLLFLPCETHPPHGCSCGWSLCSVLSSATWLGGWGLASVGSDLLIAPFLANLYLSKIEHLYVRRSITVNL